jgi:hypothetical protein
VKEDAMSDRDDDITPEPTVETIDKYRKAYSAILDGKVETRLRRVKYGDSETAAIVVTRDLGKGRERVIPLFVAINDEILAELSTMWGDKFAKNTKTPVRSEPKMRESEDSGA